MPRRILRVLASILLLLLLVPPAYFSAALLGGLVPANANWVQPKRGITIFVETNGIHTWIAMPIVTKEMDWRSLVPTSHISNPSLAGDYVAIGYGNRDFYLNTPEWKGLTARRALGAAFGMGPGLVHVYHEPKPQADSEHRPIVLSAGQYRRLAAYIAASFDRDSSGMTKPLLGRGYGSTDVFYEARGSYDLFYTCNEWAGEGLREAGVRVGVWTPFTEAIMRRI